MRRAVSLVLCLAACSQQASIATTTVPGDTLITTTTTLPETTSSIGTISTSTTTLLPTLQGLGYLPVGALDFPVQVVARPGEQISYVIIKPGLIFPLEQGVIGQTAVLDISDRVQNGGERGLLSMALSEGPEHLYLHYTANDGDTVVSEFDFLDPRTADPGSERVLLRLDQPAPNHNGGMIQLVGDLLYLGLGDGGGANDQFGNGQDLSTLLGGLVAISTVGDPNPYLFNSGLRNPWRFQIDDGLIYVADVGQSSYEEVSVTPLVEGANFGWPITEGAHCFRPTTGCDPTGTIMPVIEVAHGDAGTCSITGGIVYRGAAIPEIVGSFFYSDYCGGYLRSFRFDDGEAVDEIDWTDQVGVPGRVTGFGYDGDGEMYVLTDSVVLQVVAVR